MGHGTEDVVAVGELTDEVLLLCGEPGSTPSAWWTPTLVDRADDELAGLLEATDQLLVDVGARDPDTGRLSGPLGDVAAVIHDVRLVVLLETRAVAPGGDEVRERRSVVIGEQRALLDLHEPETGVHDLLLAAPRSAVALVADLLTSSDPPSELVRALAGVRSPAEVAAVLPEHERIATTRITRTTVARDGDPGGVHMVTLVEHDAGAVACWALPEREVHVQVLDEESALDVALVLLGADAVEVAA